jgi:hypothetical protein
LQKFSFSQKFFIWNADTDPGYVSSTKTLVDGTKKSIEKIWFFAEGIENKMIAKTWAKAKICAKTFAKIKTFCEIFCENKNFLQKPSGTKNFL